jgi:hypothetical protein
MISHDHLFVWFFTFRQMVDVSILIPLNCFSLLDREGRVVVATWQSLGMLFFV